MQAAPATAQDWAVGGYDAVSLMSQQAPQPGRADIATLWQDRLWQFASESNREQFEANPREYVPAFEGLCPVALSQGRKIRGDPRHAIVIDGQLYLLRSAGNQRQLVTSPEAVLSQARSQWAALR